jgi:hypothetical protein
MRQVTLVGYPETEIMVNCKQSCEIRHANVALGTAICLKPGTCTCIEYGQVLKDDWKEGFNGNDVIDRLSSGDL